jgi:hypothetical protein
MPIIGTLAGVSARGLGGLRTFGAASSQLQGYYSIATATVDSSPDSYIQFDNIPTDYTHLQIRGIIRAHSSGPMHTYFRFATGNGSIDTGSNYNSHLYGGSGDATPFTENYANSTTIEGPPVTSTGNHWAGVVADILDYQNTNKFKTLRSYGGFPQSAGGYLFFTGGTWRNTGAITSIRFLINGADVAEYSQLALYGIGKKV